MQDLILAVKAFADPTRLRVLRLLRDRELCVCELCDTLNVTQSTLSTHLQVIRSAGLVSARKQGKWMYYATAPGTRPLVNSLFRFFSGSLDTDTVLRRDAKTLSRRLSLRTNGDCCVGFGESKLCGKSKS